MEEQTKLHLQRELAIAEQAFGSVHREVITSLNNLAMYYYTQGNYVQAEPLYKRSLAICEQVLGPDHPYTATCLNNLAELYRAQSKNIQAELLLKRALVIWERVLGASHPTTVTVRENYTDLSRKMNQEEGAEGESASDSTASVMIDGESFPVAESVDALCVAIEAEGRGVFRFCSLEYKNVLGQLTQKLEKHYGQMSCQYRDAIASPLLCASCLWELPGSYKLSLLQAPELLSNNIFFINEDFLGATPGFDR